MCCVLWHLSTVDRDSVSFITHRPLVHHNINTTWWRLHTQYTGLTPNTSLSPLVCCGHSVCVNLSMASVVLYGAAGQQHSHSSSRGLLLLKEPLCPWKSGMPVQLHVFGKHWAKSQRNHRAVEYHTSLAPSPSPCSRGTVEVTNGIYSNYSIPGDINFCNIIQCFLLWILDFRARVQQASVTQFTIFKMRSHLSIRTWVLQAVQHSAHMTYTARHNAQGPTAPCLPLD